MVNVETFRTERQNLGVMKRLENVVTEVSGIRERLGKLQSRIDGVPEKTGPDEVPLRAIAPAMKNNLDGIETDLRAIVRVLSAIEEIF
jgi:hypothetical protein